MRLQFHKDFTFADAERLVPYLVKLGISHVYASPITTARTGSLHGYDVVDPTRVNPELGGEEGLRRLVAALRAAGLGLIADIVPNHMAIGPQNAWWVDVLKNGRASPFAEYFDIDWEPENRELRGKVLLPVLGKPLADALAAGEITLSRQADGECAVRYFDHYFPLAPNDEAEVRRAPAEFAGRERLHGLLRRQHYRLAGWRVANDEINWRRFFDINELIGLRMEHAEAFESVHALIFRLYAEGLIDGVRVDHVDGLSDPAAYCRALRQRLEGLHRNAHHPRRRLIPTSWSKRSCSPARICPTHGVATAPPVTTSWRRSAPCCMTPAPPSCWDEPGLPSADAHLLSRRRSTRRVAKYWHAASRRSSNRVCARFTNWNPKKVARTSRAPLSDAA
jgi:(1->4)-alpha-D-glucan 1-alpha-D-glucosylmutase